MAANQHFQRLKHIYASTSAAPEGERVAISYGHAELDAHLQASTEDAIVARMPHHRLLSDVASLAAGSLEKEHLVDAEQFSVNVEDPEYEGLVVATAEVVLVEPPRSIVHALLLGEDGGLVAEATGVFQPTPRPLPPDPSPDQTQSGTSPRPATVMPVATTPFGVLCLN